ncbi:ATP-dependent RNA helicase DDX42-like [Tubulanus polymorphus]|uniref:ATP-dependent RNA helicase DDX42-like n=1 Tax=Tubulanus polymorphus TaxID=672921 RepID=UPI003DA46962
MYHKGGDGRPKGFGFGGFSMSSSSSDGSSSGGGRNRDRDRSNRGSDGKNRGVAIPPSPVVSQTPGRGYENPLAIPPPIRGGTYGQIGKRRVKSEEDYFDEEDIEEHKDLEYQPVPGSPTFDKNLNDSDDSDDPLDAFMAGIECEVKKQTGADVEDDEKQPKKKQQQQAIRDDIEEEDVQESYFRYMEENPLAGVYLEDDTPLDYDEEGNPIIPEKNKIIDPLPPVDHTMIDYDPFEKNFYTPHEEISRLSLVEVDQLRRTLGIRVSGFSPPKPVTSFGHFGFDEQLMNAVRKAEYTKPTPIQAQGIPVALCGRDIIGVAKTGSGKTAAFLWPLFVHILDQKNLAIKDGPIGLILAPTRELSQQIYHEAKRFGKVFNFRVVCAYGGGSMYEQGKACEEGAEIIVATPGRLIDLVKKKHTNLQRVTYLVFDEADRMFDMGFETQVRSIANHVRPDRQTLLFSATFKRKVERLARDILTDPVRVVQGELGEANEDVTQIVEVLPEPVAKWIWIRKRLVEFTSVGSVLIFVTRKANCVELSDNLKKNDFSLGVLHGDMSQTERNEIITGFKKKDFPILVATDVAARGLDIPSIKTVVNYDVARDIDTHTHRIGRTGRAGEKGTAFTLITAKDKDFAGHLVRNLEVASQLVPQSLIDLALQNPWFKKSRYRNTKGRNMGGKGFGFKDRPGLGAESSTGGSTGSNTGFAAYERGVHGPQGDRVASMKAAFASQFRSNFISSDGGLWKPGTGHIELKQDPLYQPAAATAPAPPAAVQHQLQSSFLPPPPPPSSSDQNSHRKRKKSRWE